jgi:hypothetical protein
MHVWRALLFNGQYVTPNQSHLHSKNVMVDITNKKTLSRLHINQQSLYL